MGGRRWKSSLVLLSAVGLVFAACGRGQEGGARGDGQGTGKLAAVPGFDPARKTIKLGVVSAFTGPAAVIGVPYTAGNRVFFDAVNTKGGVAGEYRVELVTEDNMFDPATTIQKYQKLKDRVVLFAQIFSTPATKAVLPQLEADGVLGAPASIDAAWVGAQNLLPLASTVQIQALNGIDWYLKKGGGRGKTVCSLAVENPLGDAADEGMRLAEEAHGFKVKLALRFKDTDPEFKSQVNQLKNAGCQAVFLTSLPANMGPILGAGVELGFEGLWIGEVSTWVTGLARSPQLLPVLQRQFVLVHDGPAWGDESVPGMKAMLADLAKYAPEQVPDIYVTGGYAHAKAVTALLEKAVERGDLSREGILAAQAELGTISFGGLLGDYTYGPPEKRNPTRTSTIFKVNPAVPGALEVVEPAFASESARKFSFAQYLR